MNVPDKLAHRAAQATVTMRKPDGAPLVKQEVTVAQRSHKFRFGNTAWEIIGLANDMPEGEMKAHAELINEHFFKLFNTATLPFYWGYFERERGKPNTEALLKGAQWFVDRGCVLKGHTLCWHSVGAPCRRRALEMRTEPLQLLPCLLATFRSRNRTSPSGFEISSLQFDRHGGPHYSLRRCARVCFLVLAVPNLPSAS